MSETNQDAPLLGEEIAIPEGDVVDDAPPPAGRKGISPVMKLALIGGSVVALLAAAMIFSSSQGPGAPSETRRPAALDSTPGGNVQASSAEYQQSLRTLNERRAQEAAELGVTSIPTPEAILRPSARIEQIGTVERTAGEDEPEERAEPEEKPVVASAPRIIRRPPPPVVPRTRPAEERAPAAAPAVTAAPAADQEVENPYVNRIGTMMSRGVKNFAAKPMVVSEVASGKEGDEDADAMATHVPQAETGPDYSSGNLLLRPGDVLYAETLTTVTSDMQSPVLAEVVHGPHKGARVVGDFSADKASGRMVVTFRSMTFEDGNVYDIEAVAVDGKSAETAVASDVHRRYVARYAPILAATFISGFAQALAQPSQTVVGSGDSMQIVTDGSTTENALASGLAAASAAVASDIASTAPKGPKIILQAGWPIGILITDRVLIDTPVREDAAYGVTTGAPTPGMPSRLPRAMQLGSSGQ